MANLDLSTYNVAVYQSRAARTVQGKATSFLRQHDLTVMQWSILGYVYDAGKKGVRISDLAKILDTSLAFITNSINVLESKGMVYRADHDHDNRAKLVFVTDGYRKKVQDIEKKLREHLLGWMHESMSKEELATFMATLQKIAELSE